MTRLHPALDRFLATVNSVVLGKPDVVEHAVTAVLAGGHILLEDVPGVGKTTLAHALARALGCSFRRIQFTSDLLPSDILGVNVFVPETAGFEFRAGPIFANVVLADEINRTTPKTQSSLLEAMNERQVSIDNETRPLPSPFVVIATQNPQDFHGTYPLPESQLDRFMVRLHLGHPTEAVERAILRGRRGVDPAAGLAPVLSAEVLVELQAAVGEIRVDELILDYLLGIVGQTRRSPQLELGVSTRGALALQRAAQARALLQGRTFVIPDDVKALAVPVLAHRVQVAGATDGLLRANEDAERLIQRLVEQVPVPA
ncbi:MAG: AAA family ATPase [Myxococcales bacterium]|nr:AAA family ATPase [Myxococcales bacterium]